jgi:hypothetical protein
MGFVPQPILHKQDKAQFQVHEKSCSVVVYDLDLIFGVAVPKWATSCDLREALTYPVP